MSAPSATWWGSASAWQVHGMQAQVVVDAYAAVWYAQRSNPLPEITTYSTQPNPHPIINIFREYRFVFLRVLHCVAAGSGALRTCATSSSPGSPDWSLGAAPATGRSRGANGNRARALHRRDPAELPGTSSSLRGDAGEGEHHRVEGALVA